MAIWGKDDIAMEGGGGWMKALWRRYLTDSLPHARSGAEKAAFRGHETQGGAIGRGMPCNMGFCLSMFSSSPEWNA